ncbi:MAG: hypothetical protein R3C59_30730 [Planctomycetaceae bacterium]
MLTASRKLLLLSVALLTTHIEAGEIQQVSGKRTGDSGGCGEEIGYTNYQPQHNDALYTDVEGDIQPVGYSDGSRSRGRNQRGSQRRRGNNCQSYCNTCCDDRGFDYRGTWNDTALNWCGPKGPTGRLCAAGCPCAQKACACCNTKGFPDSGWAPPAHVPVGRSGGSYTQYWPNQWYGNPGGNQFPSHPMVYQPTDTTQLGYSYANVPTWRPNNSMIPPVPQPSNFHHRYCPVDPRCDGCSGCVGEISGGGCMDTGIIYGEGYPTMDLGEMPISSLQRMQDEQAANLARNRGVRPSRGVQATVAAAEESSGWRAAGERASDDRAGQATQLVSAQAGMEQAYNQTPSVRPQSVRPQQSRSQTVRPQQVRPVNGPRPSNAPMVAQRPANNQMATRPQQQSRQNSRSKQKTGGWFGWPSLSEMTF